MHFSRAEPPLWTDNAIAWLPASTVSNKADEALGKQGTLSAPNGTRVTIDSVASHDGSSVSVPCKQMGSAAVQFAASLQQNGMAPIGMAMPGMPIDTVMPAMPGAQPQ
jgi:hypothetical protein